jgi:hypothetical protein
MDGRRARIVLGVADDAGPDDIRRAFRARARVTHPDRGGDRHAFNDLVAAAHALRPVPATVPAAPALPAARGPVDLYDSPARRPARRDFADVLRAATARLA